ncbi:MAG: hypothetical protein R3195_01135 [Gemmatimonadota bacterium]|nr:hypothetical protein [Gemmatimonadota bacterium]
MASNDPERRPAWLERMESGGPTSTDDDSTSPGETPVTELPRTPDNRGSRTTPGAAAYSAAAQLEQTGIARLREEAERAARQDADAGVPDPESEGQSESERDLRERCRAFYDRWSFQYRRQVHDEVAGHEEVIADRLGRASLAVDKYERLTNELMRVKARRAVRHREVTDDIRSESGDGTLSTRVYLLAISFLGLVEFFANAPVFSALLPRDVLTERQIRLVTETSDGWFAGAERVFAQIILRPDAALLAAGVVTFLCVLAHFFGHSLRELVMLRDTAERHHTVSAKSSTENIIPMILTGLGLLLVLGVLYEARIRLGEVGEAQYQSDIAQVEEWNRQAQGLVADGQLLEANAMRAQAEDLQAAATALAEYANSMSRLSWPILLLNLTLVICALCAAYFHKGDRRREHFNENPFERDRTKIIAGAEAAATEVAGYMSELAKHIRGLKSVSAVGGAEEQRGVVRELESVIALYRAENGRARGLDPRSIRAFRDPVDLGIEIQPHDDETLKPLRSPVQYEDERRELQDRFQTVRGRFNNEAIAW